LSKTNHNIVTSKILFGGVRVAHLFIFLCVVLLCVFTFWVSLCDVRYDFHIKRCLVSSLPPVVCRRRLFYLLYLCLFAHSGVQHILCCVFVLFFFTLCALSCQCLWIVHYWLPLRCSLKFIWQSKHLHHLRHVLLNIPIRINFDLAC
jgi:hypothetical protein